MTLIRWKHKRAVLFATLLFLVLSATATAQQDLASWLQSSYQGRVWRIANSYQGSRLEFVSDGTPKGRPRPGPWTLSSIGIENIKVSPRRIEFEGPRVVEIYDRETRKLKLARTKEKIRITVELDNATSPTKVEMILSRILASPGDLTVDMVPPFWKRYVAAQIQAVPQGNGKNCYQFRGDLLANGDGGAKAICAATSTTATDPAAQLPERLTHKGVKGMSPPKPLRTTDPSYPALAKAERYQATVKLSVDIDEKGNPQNPDIEVPAGLGLDEAAVEAVRTWRFQPAMLKDEAVPIRIYVEVNFRLY